VSSAGTWSGSPTTFTANSSGDFIIPISYTEAAVNSSAPFSSS
jgi:hypothetical protein